MIESRPLRLVLLPERYAVARLDAAAPVPPWADAGSLVSVTRTNEELSIVCPESAVPDGPDCERGFRCLKVQGPLEFSQTGVLSSLASPLAEAKISLFALATFDTDYILIRESDLDRGVLALRGAGHEVRSVRAGSEAVPEC